MNNRADAPLHAALAAVWEQAMGVASADVRPVGAVNVQRLAGLSPLTLQTCLSRESRRLVAIAGQANTGATASPPLVAVRGANEDLGGLDLTAQPDHFMPMAPDQPAVFLLTAYLAWDHKKSHPTCQEAPGAGVDRMRDLMTAVFTHGMKQTADVTASSRTAPTGVAPYLPRQVHKPIIHLGQPQPLHGAVTEGQWMQIAWMAQSARKSARQFQASQSQQGNFLTWSASLLNDQDEIDSTLCYTYDAFWRPQSHVQTILDRIDLAQGSGQMPSAGLLRRLFH